MEETDLRNAKLHFILGASDIEMLAIHEFLVAVCAAPENRDRVSMSWAEVFYGCERGRVDQLQAYEFELTSRIELDDPEEIVVLVECDSPKIRDEYDGRIIVCDHHRPGDPGWGVDAYHFFAGSSLGQVMSLCAKAHLIPVSMREEGVQRFYHANREEKVGDICETVTAGKSSFFVVCWTWETRLGNKTSYHIKIGYVFAAIIDHCLFRAYRTHHVRKDQVHAALTFYRNYHDEIQTSDLEHYRQEAWERIVGAPKVEINGVEVADLREYGVMPFAPEAAAMNALERVIHKTQPAILGFFDPDVPNRVTLHVNNVIDDEVVPAFVEWCEDNGIHDVAANSERGFAYGYVG